MKGASPYEVELYYKSTRNSDVKITASQAVLKGLADDGGLFVPERIPALDKSLRELSKMDYKQTAYEVMKLYLTDYTKEELCSCIDKAYDDKFDTEEIAPLRKCSDGIWFLELFHGPTIAFKDMALSILPHLLTTAAKKNHVNDEIVILTATSGDTGKAALAGFSDVEGTSIMVFYPKCGVSPIQERQMVTQKGKNTTVVAVHGNFDDAQNGVKAIFGDKELREEMAAKGFRFSSANSINIGRLVPQIVYYVYAYASLLSKNEIEDGEEIDVTVPTGNFGNILAAFYAKNMGVPIRRLICASNENKVLYDFFMSGKYDRNRDFILTSSPSMDILISSNLERLIYRLTGEKPDECRRLMESLLRTGSYDIDDKMREGLSAFRGGFATEQETRETILSYYKKEDYVLDTHTAVAAAVAGKYRDECTGSGEKPCKMVIVSTASPYKFTRSVMSAIDRKYGELPGDISEDFKLTDELSRISGTAVPGAIEEIKEAKILHKTECDAAKMKDVVKGIQGL